MNNDVSDDDVHLFTYAEHIFKNSVGIAKDIFNLFTLEVKLAGKSLAIILILMVLTALLLISSWFSLLGALVTFLLNLHFSVITSLCLVSAINLIIAIIMGIYIYKFSRNLQFKETRKQFDIMRDDNEIIRTEDRRSKSGDLPEEIISTP